MTQRKKSTKTAKKTSEKKEEVNNLVIDTRSFDTDEGAETHVRLANHPMLAEGAEAHQLSVNSETKLESDTGTGDAVILRVFEFSVNPQMIGKLPSPQEIFNSHVKGIEGLLWNDGMYPRQDIPPRVVFSKNGQQYRIFVTASARHTLVDIPQTLTQILNGRNKSS